MPQRQVILKNFAANTINYNFVIASNKTKLLVLTPMFNVVQ